MLEQPEKVSQYESRYIFHDYVSSPFFLIIYLHLGRGGSFCSPSFLSRLVQRPHVKGLDPGFLHSLELEDGLVPLAQPLVRTYNSFNLIFNYLIFNTL